MDLRSLFGKKKKPAAAETNPAHRIDVLVERGHLREALDLLKSRLRRYPDSIGTRMKYAQTLARAGRASEAVIEYLAVADAYFERHLLDRSVQTLRLARQLVPDHPAVARRFAKLERMRGSVGLLERLSGKLAHSNSSFERTVVTPPVLRRLWEGLCMSPLLSELDDGSLLLLLDHAEVSRWDSGSNLARMGQTLSRCYLITRGSIAASFTGTDGGRAVVREFGPGDLIGVGPLLDGTLWSADYTTTSDFSEALRVTQKELPAIRRDPLGDKLIGVLRKHGVDPLADKGERSSS